MGTKWDYIVLIFHTTVKLKFIGTIKGLQTGTFS